MNNDELIVYLPYILDFLKDLIIASIPSIFAFLIFRHTSQKDKIREIEQSKKEILNKRLEQLYIPFYIEIHNGDIPIKFKEAFIDTSDEFFDNFQDAYSFFTKNPHLMDYNSQMIFNSLLDFTTKINFCFNTTHTIDNSNFITLKQDFVTTYNSFIDSMFNEYQQICNELGYPNPCFKLEL